MHNGPPQGHRETTLPVATSSAPRTPLHEAAACGNDTLVEEILSAGADRNHKEFKHGNTPLHEAAWRGHSRCVKALCTLPTVKEPPKDSKSKQIKNVIAHTQGSLHSALLSTRNTGGFSALHLAAQNGHNQSCREILLAGGDANVQNNYGDTPLHTACRYGHAGATRILLSGNADPLRVNLNGDSPLHIACAMGRRKLTRILLASGGSLVIQNAQKETARDICVRKSLHEILEILNAPPVAGDTQQMLRDRSSSSSKHKERTPKGRPSNSNTKSSPKTPNGNEKYDVNAKNWSPYGCHYFPDPKSFPSPKLETLPKEPLSNGEQYFLDLAGNIRKGPVGVGNTCYCGPFFRHIEDKISRNKKSIKKYVHKATEKLDIKVQALAMKTDDQIEQITRKMLADRIHCDGQRMHLEQWLKRGDRTRATMAAHTSKSHKDETNTNTLTRCRSLELLDSNAYVETMHSSTPGISRSFDLLNSNTVHHRVDVHAEYRPSEDEDHNGDNDSYVRTAIQTSQPDHIELKHYYLDSDKEWQYHGSSKNESSDKERFSSISGRVGNRFNSSEKDHNSLEGRSDSEMSRNARMAENKSGVAARLEELLSKTNEIIEMERMARRKSNEVFSMFSAEKPGKSRKYSKYGSAVKDSSRVGASSRSSGGGRSTAASGYEDSLVKSTTRSKSYDSSVNESVSFQIAQEMEKITSSLLGSSMRDRTQHPSHQSSPVVPSDQGPVSPEIAKEFVSKKELLMAREKERESSGMLSDGSHKSFFMSDFTSQEAKALVVKRANGGVMRRDALSEYHSSSSRSIASPANRNNRYATSGALTSEAETNSAAASPSAGITTVNGFYQNSCFENGNESDIGSLKSEDKPDGTDIGSLDTDDERLELSEMANMKALNELKSRILNGAHWRDQLLLKGLSEVVNEQNVDKPDALSLPVRSKVQELVAKLQSTETHCMDPGYINTGPENEDLSESSDEEEEEEDDDDDEVDGETIRNHNGNSRQDNYAFNYSNESDVLDMLPMERGPLTGQSMDRQTFSPTNFIRYDNRPPVAPRPKPFVDLRTFSNEFIPIATPSVQPPSTIPPPQSVIDTRYLIPKDAYFHELPHRTRPVPLAETATSTFQLNPRPTTSFNPPLSNPHHPPEPPPTLLVTTRPIFYQSHHLLPMPHREKLLSSRKFTRIPSTLINAPPPHVATTTDHSAPDFSTTQFMDQVQMERDSNNDSGFSTRLSGGSQHSPSLSGRLERDAALEYPNGMGGAHGGPAHFEPYFMANIGASSLV